MRKNLPRIGLGKLCGWFGITRQAYYQNAKESEVNVIKEDLVLREVLRIRHNHPRMGTRKLHLMLIAFLDSHNIKLGRDGLFDLLSANYLLIRRIKRSVRTTNSSHWLRKYPNLIKGFVPNAPNQLWVSDITYWKISTGKNLYISFITDAYSHAIVGYHVANTLEAIESIQALQMALSSLGEKSHLQLIHHSDRGLQYCSNDYVNLLNKKGIKISMTESGDPLDNALAERINGIIKLEYLEAYDVTNIEEAKALLDEVVKLYNVERPHMSISNLTPKQVHESSQNLKTERKWKNYYRKNPRFVNAEQDLAETVNLCQD
jgi:transposase InsO family protein